MKVRVPDYFDEFFCLAGACPHSCCMKWEVVLDEDTVRRYQAAEGPLGERLRAAMRFDSEDWCFSLNGGRCPFLNGENLCEVHLAWGEEATSVTCREHPRFTEDYGPFREITLSASCPKANELLLGSRDPLTFLEREDGDAAEEGDPWLSWLIPLRDRLLDLLRDRDRSLPERLRCFLLTAAAAQTHIDADDTELLREHPISADAALSGDAAAGKRLPGEALRFLETLEVLEPDWRRLLRQAESNRAADVPAPLLERVAVYFAFRYLPKAVNDGDLLGRAELCVFALLVVRRLAAVCGLSEALRRFSCEIEHDEDNLEAMLAAFTLEDAFSLPAFLAADWD